LRSRWTFRLRCGSPILGRSETCSSSRRTDAEQHACGVRVWGVEGAGHYGARLTRYLGGRGEAVLKVGPPRARGAAAAWLGRPAGGDPRGGCDRARAASRRVAATVGDAADPALQSLRPLALAHPGRARDRAGTALARAPHRSRDRRGGRARARDHRPRPCARAAAAERIGSRLDRRCATDRQLVTPRSRPL
jgi:hypothetical protein